MRSSATGPTVEDLETQLSACVAAHRERCGHPKPKDFHLVLTTSSGALLGNGDPHAVISIGPNTKNYYRVVEGAGKATPRPAPQYLMVSTPLSSKELLEESQHQAKKELEAIRARGEATMTSLNAQMHELDHAVRTCEEPDDLAQLLAMRKARAAACSAKRVWPAPPFKMASNGWREDPEAAADAPLHGYEGVVLALGVAAGYGGRWDRPRTNLRQGLKEEVYELAQLLAPAP